MTVRRNKSSSAQKPRETSAPRDFLPARITDEDSVESPKGLLTSQVIQISIQKGNGFEEVQKLFNAELDYNRRRLEILREHAEKHPDAVEERRTKRFRRRLYGYLALLALVLFAAMPFVGIGVASVFGVCALAVVAGILVNARDRDSDARPIMEMLKRLITKS